ncbi:MAG: protein phosphatase 2C domain-containing protein, partial [Cyanobacteria bacterium REEB65]|nr:protein phosphatase 2C domain-containing protein [Cyanobacteria bacterium REEB65]
MEITCAARTNVGIVRKENQDRCLLYNFKQALYPDDAGDAHWSVTSPGAVFAVADGMGGAAAGGLAAEHALKTFVSLLPARPGRGWPDTLKATVESTHRSVLDLSRSSPKLLGMGTTLTVALAEKSELHIAHVGDSRAYLLRQGKLTRLTTDHSLVEKIAKMKGGLKSAHPQSNLLIQCIGGRADDMVIVELSRTPL